MANPYENKAISGNVKRNNGGTVFQGGNISASNVTTGTVNQSQPYQRNPGNVMLAVSALSSGNVGTKKALSTGTFGKTTDGEYVAIGLADTLAGVANTTLLKSASARQPKTGIAFTEGDRRHAITSWSYTTGFATTGAGGGSLMSWGHDEARDVPSHLAYAYGGAIPATGAFPTTYAP